MPFTRIMIHAMWATKGRKKLITSELKPLLLAHIKENSLKKGVFIDCLNCVEDHIHLLISLGNEQTVAKTMQLIKGESSFWINKQGILKTEFEWQDEYIAFSVSVSALEKVRSYIANQEQHHAVKTFDDEYKSFMTAQGFNTSDFG